MIRGLRLLGFALGLWLAAAAAASAAVALVQTGTPVTNATSASSPIALTLATAPSASNLVVLVVFNDASSDAGNSPANSTASISTPAGFTAGPTYTYDTNFGGTTNPMILATFYATSQTATSYNVTFACSTGCKAGGYALELSGANNASPINASAFNQQTFPGSNITITGPSVTPTVANTLAIGGFWFNDDSEYHGNDLVAGKQTSGWTEPVPPYPTASGFLYPGFEMQTVAPSTSIAPSGLTNQTNDSASPILVGYTIVFAPSSAVALNCIVPGWIGAYEYGPDFQEPPWVGAIEVAQ